MMHKLCIIPARGGSKRIPKKNIKEFLGKPIIAYSIEAAINSELFDEIMVSTDSEEIANIAKEYGAVVPFMRSDENANDHATTFDVIREVLEQYKNILNKDFEIACCLYATAPFVSADLLLKSYSKFDEEKFDTVFPVINFGFPIQRAMSLNEDGKITFVYPENAVVRSQDLEIRYHDTGQFYWINVSSCLEKGALITENSGCVVVDEMSAQDIDTEMDWKLAEMKYGML